MNLYTLKYLKFICKKNENFKYLNYYKANPNHLYMIQINIEYFELITYIINKLSYFIIK